MREIHGEESQNLDSILQGFCDSQIPKNCCFVHLTLEFQATEK